MTRRFTIGDRVIDDSSAPYVICEISHNHLGSVELAREMIRLAGASGADAVKFQRRGRITYEGLRSGGQVEYADLRAIREFPGWDYALLMREAHNRGLDFIATAFDQESADFLVAKRSDNIDAIKIASGDITNTPLLEYVAKLGKPMIVSTGGCEMPDVFKARDALRETGVQHCFLHCTSEYPCPVGDANLSVIESYRHYFPNTVIGFSSHIHRGRGYAHEAVAYTLGARIFEKHFSITHDIGTGEHEFSLGPRDLFELKEGLLDVQQSLGDGIKRVRNGEATGILRLGKHLVYARDLPAGHVLTADDFQVAAPGNGIPPNRMGELVGVTLVGSVNAGETVTNKQGDTVTNKATVDSWGVELVV